MKKEHQILFEPMKIGKLTCKNKYFMAAMGTLADNDESGCYTDRAIEYFIDRARGGVGLIITGANYVDNEVEVHQPCLFPSPNKLPAKYMKKARDLTDRCHAYDTKIFLQLTAGTGRGTHPGKGRSYIAPSETANRFDPSITHRAMTTEEVEYMIQKFGEAAAIAKQSGFDGVEVHAVHEGFLLDCFTLSLYNQRTDKYGGSLENRLRFPVEIVQRIKQVCGQDFPVILRYSLKSYIKAVRQGGLPGEEFEEKGRDIEEGLEAAKILEAAGYDAFNTDGGNYDSWYWPHPPIYFEEGTYLHLSEILKKNVSVPVIAAGKLYDPDLASAALREGRVDGIGLARPLLADPDLVNKVRAEQVDFIRPCLGCHTCISRPLERGMGSCAVNPACGRETMLRLYPAVRPKKVVVVGGGPAGMEAARVAALRGHSVVLFEASDRLGGAMRVAGGISFKKDELRLVRYYEIALSSLGVDVRLNTPAAKEQIDACHPDVLITAEGSKVALPAIPGADKGVLLNDVLTGTVPVGNTVIIVGGTLAGCELALDLTLQGKKVTVLEAGKDILSGGVKPAVMNEWMLRDLLKFHNVAIKTETSVTALTEDGVCIDGPDGSSLLTADQTIFTFGYRSDAPVFEECKYAYDIVYNIGDAHEMKNIRSAVWAGYEVASGI